MLSVLVFLAGAWLFFAGVDAVIIRPPVFCCRRICFYRTSLTSVCRVIRVRVCVRRCLAAASGISCGFAIAVRPTLITVIVVITIRHNRDAGRQPSSRPSRKSSQVDLDDIVVA